MGVLLPMSTEPVNTAEQRLRGALLDSQRQILERISSGAPLTAILETLVRLIEEQANGMRCAVLLADSALHRLSFAAAPNIPEDYKAGIEPFLRIAPDMGSCGTAAFLRKPVYTKDTGNDPLWKDCRGIAVRNGLRAIWSTPILSNDGTVLGTFAMYYGEPRLPSSEHIQLVDMAVQMARVAIEARRSEELLAIVIDTIPKVVRRALPELRRNRLSLVAGAHRIGQFPGAAAPGNRFLHPTGDEIVAADRGRPGRRSPAGAGLVARTVPADRRLDAEREALESLTAKERAILRLITEGRSNAEVGELLHLSPRTVETYRARLMQKLLLEDLAALVKFAIRHGMTSVD
jgi:DNA-binding NarL/FixJ family response regulator